MKIRVTTDRFNYMGLQKGSVYKVDQRGIDVHTGDALYSLTVFGKNWLLDQSECEEVEDDSSNEKESIDLKREECRSSYCECDEGKCSGGKIDMRADEASEIAEKGPIKSDGGSSSYYDLVLPEWLLYTLIERQKEGKCYIKTEEMISAFFGNDFSFGTLLKSLVRAWGIKKGAGKAGNDMKYETSKIHYYADKILEQHEEKK